MIVCIVIAALVTFWAIVVMQNFRHEPALNTQLFWILIVYGYVFFSFVFSFWLVVQAS